MNRLVLLTRSSNSLSVNPCCRATILMAARRASFFSFSMSSMLMTVHVLVSECHAMQKWICRTGVIVMARVSEDTVLPRLEQDRYVWTGKLTGVGPGAGGTGCPVMAWVVSRVQRHNVAVALYCSHLSALRCVWCMVSMHGLNGWPGSRNMQVNTGTLTSDSREKGQSAKNAW